MLVGHNEVRRQVNGGIYETHLHRNLPHTHTHARAHARTYARSNRCTHAHIYHGRPCHPHSYLIFPIFFLPSFRCNGLSIRSSTLAVVSINSLERDGLRQAKFCPCYIKDNRPNVGFLVHKDMVSAVLGCLPFSSRLIPIRLRAAPFNDTIIQVCAPMYGHDDNEVDNLYQQLHEIIDDTPKKAIWVVHGDWKGCTSRLGRRMWTLLKCWDK